MAWHLSGRSLEGRSDRLLSRLVLSAFLAMGVMVFSLSLYGVYLGEGDALSPSDEETAAALRGLFRMGALGLSAPVMLLLGGPLLTALVGMRRWLSADALVLLGCAAAWSVSVWNTFVGGGEVYFDTATAVLVLYTLGRWLDVRARHHGLEVLADLAAEREAPVLRLASTEDAAPARAGEGEVPWAELVPGDVVRLFPGEIVPVDGRVVRGRSFVDASALTGEEEPLAAAPGTRLLAGSTLLDGGVDLRVEAGVGARARDVMERLLAEARTSRPHLVRVADGAARVLLPLVLALALGTAIARGRAHGLEEGLLSALAVVLISCPCALGIATPLAYWTALGEAWRRGLLVRSGEVLERAARVERAFLDKTGTLTTGEFELVGVRTAEGLERDAALSLAAALERRSEHPLARAFQRVAEPVTQDDTKAPITVENFRALPGIGVEGVVDGRSLRLERAADSTGVETAVRLVEGERELARFLFLGELRPEAERLVRGLEARGLAPCVLTGDGAGPAAALTRELGVPVEAELLPEQKVERVGRAGAGHGSLFLGDGLNDAAALAAADVGVAMPRGSAAGQAAAGVQLLRPDLGLVLELVDLSRHAVRVARLNLAWAFGYNAIGLGLAVTGRLTPVFAASAMAASSALVVLNSGRLRTGSRPSVRSAEADRRGGPGSTPPEERPETASKNGPAPAPDPVPGAPDPFSGQGVPNRTNSTYRAEPVLATTLAFEDSTQSERA